MREEPADWFIRNLQASWWNVGMAGPVIVTPDHRRCLNVLYAITQPSGLYNLPTPSSVVDDVDLWSSGGVSVLIHTELATHDFGQLTRLVIAAHRERVRVGIKPWSAHLDERRSRNIAEWMSSDYGYEIEWDDPAIAAGVMEITLHPKAAEGSRYDTHPGLTELIESAA